MTGCRNELIALSMVPGLGPKKIIDLIGATDNIADIRAMEEVKIKELIGKGFKNTGDVRNAFRRMEYTRELDFIDNNGINVITLFDGSYPEGLKYIYDPPVVLYCRGSFRKDDENAVAIIGSRKCSVYGLQMAEKLASDLAEKGITVVSGMARGIDTAAHRGALRAKGRTIAVMGSGFGHIYPSESIELSDLIAENGAVVTEHHSDVLPLKGNFPRRNRIISGMVKAVVVVEAARKSGAMITVKYALQQGKEVMAVPGRADSVSSGGTHFLIQSGAKLVTSAQDILDEISISFSGEEEKETGKTDHIKDSFSSRGDLSPGEKSPDEKNIIDMLNKEKNMHIDKIMENSGILNSALSEVLLRMEMKGIVKMMPGKNYVLTNRSSRYQK